MMLIWYAQELQSSCVAACVRMALGAFHAIALVEITSAAITALDPLDGPASCSYGLAAFTAAWETSGRETLVIEAPPLH